MNGMAAKKQRRDKAKRFTDDGVPRDPCEWTYEDWNDLFFAVAAAVKKIHKRHRKPVATTEGKGAGNA